MSHYGITKRKAHGRSKSSRTRGFTAREDRSSADQEAMLQRSGRLHIACELRHAPQRLAAVRTPEPMLGVRSWTTVNLKSDRSGSEEAMCLWLNSTPGPTPANLPRKIARTLGRSGLPHELMRSLPLLNVDALSEEQLQRARVLFEELKNKTLHGFSRLATDPVRRELDRRLLAEVLGHDERDTIGRTS